jgi:PAS domain S-box-containing protein
MHGGPFKARRRQAEALVEALASPTATIVAGDFNTWRGSADSALDVIRRAFPIEDQAPRTKNQRGLVHWVSTRTSTIPSLAASVRCTSSVCRTVSVRITTRCLPSLSLRIQLRIKMAPVGESRAPNPLAEQQLAAIIDSSSDAIVGKDLRSIITSWNAGAERLFGYTAVEAIGQPISLIIPPDRRSEEDRVIASLNAGHRVEPFETLRRRRDGSLIDVSVTVSPIKNASGAIVGAFKIARDITARVRLRFLAEVGVVLSSSLDYAATLDRAVHLALPRLGDYCTMTVHDERRVLRHVASGHVIPAKEQIVRDLAVRAFDRRAAIGMPTFAETIVKTGRVHVVSHAEFARLVARVDPNQVDEELLRLATALQPYAYIGAPLTARGQMVGAISFGTTEQESRREYTDGDVELLEEFARRVSMAIENARLFRQTQELNRLKDEFLATLSHEMRTPLSAILGWTRILAANLDDAARMRHAIEAVERNAQAQAQIVDDVLDLARGMAGNLRLDMRLVDLVAVAERGLEAVAPAASAKKIPIEVHAIEPVPIVGDAGRLQQVVWNLVSNAVKFTPPGGRVTIDVHSSGSHAELRVVDTGRGIPADFLPHVFEKFRQADATATREHRGLGLGLAIARHLVEMHGGSIAAHSEGEGRGATFVVRLPLQTAGSKG